MRTIHNYYSCHHISQGYEEHPIVPVMLAGGLVDTFADEMMEKGIYVVAFKKPVVPEGTWRLNPLKIG